MKLTHCVSIVFTGTSLSLINNPSKTFEKMRLTYAKLGRHLFEVAFVNRRDDYTSYLLDYGKTENLLKLKQRLM